MKIQRLSLEEADALARRDKRRIIAFGVGAALIAVAYFTAPRFGGGGEQVTELPVPLATVPDVPLEPLPFEDPEALAKIRDASPEQRMTLDTEALVPAFHHARNQNEQLFKVLGIVTLDATIHAALLAAPETQRLKALRTRGEVLDVERRRREGGTRDDWFVTLRDGAGLISHALFATPPNTTLGAALGEDADAVRVGDYLRVDGLFFKVFRQEVGGAWLEGPLVLGHRAIASYPPVDEPTARAAPALERVRDDEVGELFGRDDEALWQLMARAKLLDKETDWSAAQEVDSALLARMFKDGAAHRGMPVRFPISRNMGAWAGSAPENPLGLERFTLGWIGNVMWRTPVGVVQWMAPFDMPQLADWNNAEGAQFVEARGWFFRNEVYTKSSGEPGRAPLFVLAAVEPFVPPPDKVVQAILWFVLALTAVVIGTIYLLLRSDKKKSTELQESLTRRRRERRQRSTLGGPGGSVGTNVGSGAGAGAGPA